MQSQPKAIEGLDDLSAGAIELWADLRRLRVGFVADPDHDELFYRNDPAVTPALHARIERHAHELINLVARQPAGQADLTPEDAGGPGEMLGLLLTAHDQFVRVLAFPGGRPTPTDAERGAATHLIRLAGMVVEKGVDFRDLWPAYVDAHRKEHGTDPHPLVLAAGEEFAAKAAAMHPTELAYELCRRGERLDPPGREW